MAPLPFRIPMARGLALAAGLALIGTAQAAPPPAPVELPDPHAPGPVSLDGILAYADQRSPVLRVARGTRSRAEAARVAASLRLLTNPKPSLGAGPRQTADGTGVDLQLGLHQQIALGGARGRRLQAAEALADLTEAEIDALRWSVHCDVHATYHRVLVEQERARLAERVVGFQREVLRVVERQIAAGEAPPLALRLAQAEAAQAEQLQVAARQALYAARLQLGQLAGWPAAAPPLPAGAVDPPHDPPPLDALIDLARAQLPRLQVQAARVREADARAALADREAWPRPTLGVQLQREGNPGAEGPAAIALGQLALPLPGLQRNQGPRAQAQADRTVAEIELQAALDLLDGQIAEAHSEVVAAAARTRAYGDEILPGFEDSLALVRRSFELGEIDLLALSTARERFLRIQSDALGAQQDYFIALAGLERVVGVDLWGDDHHPEPHP